MRTLLFLCCLVVACTSVVPCAAYDPVVGQTAVELAAAAYCSAEQLKANTRSCTDFDGCLLDIQVLAHDDVESQGYVAYVPARNWIVVVFRGSENLQNWINNGKFHQVPYPNAECTDTEDNEPCMVHLGFLQYFLSLRDQMIDALMLLFARTEHDGKNPDVLVVGHSLGGAAALLAALDILTHDSFKALFPTTKRLSLYTFGQPRVGDPWFVTWASRVLSHSAYFRVTHRRDPVPHLPPQVFYDITNDGYLHVPPEVFFNNNLGGRNFVMCEDDSTQEDEDCSNIFSWHNPSDHSLYLNTALDCVLPIPSLQGDSSAATDSSSSSSSSPTSPPEGSSDGSSSSTRPPSSTLPPSTSGPPESLPEMPPTPLQYVYSEPSCSSALSWTGTLNVLNTAKVLTPCSFDSCCAAHSECSMSCEMPETIQRCLTAFLDCMQSACSACAIKSSSLNQQRTSFFDQDACALRALSLVAAVSERAYEIAQRQCARPGPSGLTRGDPHLLTFRHFSFDFQTPGEYVLVRSTEPLNWSFEVQVRQALMETSNSISLNKGIAISLGNSNVTLTLLASSRTAQFENDTLFSSGRGDVLFGGGFGTVGNGSVLRIRFVSQQPPSDFDIPSSLDSFGYYLMDADGHPSVGRIVWPNIRMVDDNATFDLPEVVEGTLGFFLLPGGAQYNDIHVGDEVHFELELPPPVTRPSIPDETPRELRYFLVYAETVTSESVVPRCKKLCGDAGGVPGRIFTPEQQQQVTSLVDFESQIIFAVAAQRGTGEDVFKWYWVNETTRVQFYDENSGVCSEGFFCNWLSGEPNNWHSNEPLMVLNYDWYRAKWNDYHDGWSSRQTCLCEKKAPSRAYTLANTKLIAVHQPSPSQVAIVDQCLETCRSAGGVPGTILTAEDQRQVDDVVAALNGPVYATAAKRASRNPSVWYWDHSDGLDRTLLYDMNTGVCGSFCNWHPGEPNWWGEPLIIINYEGRGGTWTDISEYSSATPTCLCRVPTGEITPPTDGPTTRVDVRSNSSCRNASLTIPVRPVTDFIHVKYYVISIEAFSFEGCIKRCGTHNSSFGVILSEEQQQQARRVIRTNTTTMLAGRLSPDGNWRWEAGPHAGEMFGYTYFEGEPNQFFDRSRQFLRMSPLGGWEPTDGTVSSQSSSTTHPSSIMCLCQQWRLATVAQRRQTPHDFSGRWIVKSTQTGAVLNGAFRAGVGSTTALHAMGGVVTFDRALLNAHRCSGTDVVKRKMSEDTTEHRWCTFLHPANDSCTSLVYSLFSVPTYVAAASLVGSHESDVFGCREPGLTRVQRFDASIRHFRRKTFSV